MAKILVVDDEQNIREILVEILVDAGHEAIEAGNGGVALEKASHEHPDIILLDLIMPVMDGLQVLARLKRDHATERIPVVLLTAVPADHAESEALKFGVTHYLTKPWKRSTLELAIKVALHEAANASERGIGTRPSMITTGNIMLDQKLGGGIPVGSLTLIEGASASGKSVLCQHFTHGSLLNGQNVAFFSSEETAKSLVAQMGSIGLEVSDYVQEGKLRIVPLEEGASDNDAEGLMALLPDTIKRLPSQYKTIVVDAITNLAAYSQDRAIIGLFAACKHLCAEGRTILLVAHSYTFEEKTLVRLRSLCDAHLRTCVEKTGAKLLKSLEVCKVHNAELDTGNVATFEVQPGIGIRISPVGKFKV